MSAQISVIFFDFGIRCKNIRNNLLELFTRNISGNVICCIIRNQILQQNLFNEFVGRCFRNRQIVSDIQPHFLNGNLNGHGIRQEVTGNAKIQLRNINCIRNRAGFGSQIPNGCRETFGQSRNNRRFYNTQHHICLISIRHTGVISQISFVLNCHSCFRVRNEYGYLNGVSCTVVRFRFQHSNNQRHVNGTSLGVFPINETVISPYHLRNSGICRQVVLNFAEKRICEGTGCISIPIMLNFRLFTGLSQCNIENFSHFGILIMRKPCHLEAFFSTDINCFHQRTLDSSVNCLAVIFRCQFPDVIVTIDRDHTKCTKVNKHFHFILSQLCVRDGSAENRFKHGLFGNGLHLLIYVTVNEHTLVALIVDGVLLKYDGQSGTLSYIQGLNRRIHIILHTIQTGLGRSCGYVNGARSVYRRIIENRPSAVAFVRHQHLIGCAGQGDSTIAGNRYLNGNCFL